MTAAGITTLLSPNPASGNLTADAAFPLFDKEHKDGHRVEVEGWWARQGLNL